MFQHNSRSFIPHSPQSIGQQEKASRITKLRNALHCLWVEKCSWGKKPEFYSEASSAYTRIGSAGGHAFLQLLDDVEVATSFNREMQKEDKTACYEAYERVLKATLKEETVESHHIDQAARRARRAVQRA